MNIPDQLKDKAFADTVKTSIEEHKPQGSRRSKRLFEKLARKKINNILSKQQKKKK